MGFEAGAIVVQLQLSKEQWNAAVKSVSEDQKKIAEDTKTHSAGIVESVGKIAKSWIGVSTAVVGAISALVLKTAAYGEELQNIHEKTGIAVETLSGLKLAADKADIGISGLSTGLKFLSKFSEDARKAGSEQADTMRRLGVELIDSSGKAKPLNTQLELMADVFAKMPAGPEKAALAMQVFGRAGMDMIPFLNMGAEGIRKEREEAERLGLVMSGPAAKASADFADLMDTLKGAFMGITLSLGQAFMPILKSGIEAVIKLAGAFRNFITQHKEVVQAVMNIVDGFISVVGWIIKAITKLEEFANKFSMHGRVMKMAMQEQSRLETEWDRQQEEGRRKWLARHEEIMKKRQDAAAKIASNAVAEKAHEEELAVAAKIAAEKRARAIEEFAKRAEVAFERLFSRMPKSSDKAFKDMEKDLAGFVKKFDRGIKDVSQDFNLAIPKFPMTFRRAIDNINSSIAQFSAKFGGMITAALQAFSMFTSAMAEKSSAYFQHQFQLINTEYEKKKAAIEKSLMSEAEKNAALEALDNEYAEKKRKLEIKQAEATKKSGITQAIINTAQAVVSALSTKPFIPMGLIAAGMALTAGMIQIGIIKNTPLPAMAQGGLITEPTNVLAGEAGPETIIPLNKFEKMMGLDKRSKPSGLNMSFTIQAWDGRDVERAVRKNVIPELKKAYARESLRVPAHAIG